MDGGDSDDDELSIQDGLSLDEDDAISGAYSANSDASVSGDSDLVESDDLPSESEESIDEKSNVRIEVGADGSERLLYPEIDPVYDSDESDKENTNRIGDIPLTLYDNFPHIGYDLNGRRIMRPAQGEALDSLLDSIIIPKDWTGLLDQNTGQRLKLSDEELEMVRRLSQNRVVDDDFNPYEDTIEYFSGKLEKTPLSAAPEPKRRFIPSLHEAKRVVKIVRAIREGRIVPKKPSQPGHEVVVHDLWADEGAPIDHPMHIPAPKMVVPGHEESYNPPPEYLPSKDEVKEWQERDDEDEDNPSWLPKKFDALRKVPGWAGFLKERFERCLDLYLAPRVRRNKLNIDPESLLPSLPSPQDLRPFPTRTATIFTGHEGRVRSISVNTNGLWLASVGDDGFVRVWETATGREIWKIKLRETEGVATEAVVWGRGVSEGLLLASSGPNLFLLLPPIWSAQMQEDVRQVATKGFGSAIERTKEESAVATWNGPRSQASQDGVCVVIKVQQTIKKLTWHRRGDYFASVSSDGGPASVCIHQLSKHQSQSPFKRSKGAIQQVDFHPTKPLLFVATQRTIRVYDLLVQRLTKTLTTGARWISSFDVHPGGDNLIVGSYDKRVLWHDLDLTDKPYKTLRYHERAIRDVRFHQGGQPLFCSASDDGTIQIFHGMVYNDLMQNPLLVGLKVLRGHKVKDGLGILSVAWHPRLAWLFSAGADGDIRLWV